MKIFLLTINLCFIMYMIYQYQKHIDIYDRYGKERQLNEARKDIGYIILWIFTFAWMLSI